MAQSTEARLARYIHDTIARLDLDMGQVALAMTSWSPAMKARLLSLVVQIAHLMSIDYTHGNVQGADKTHRVFHKMYVEAEKHLDKPDSGW